MKRFNLLMLFVFVLSLNANAQEIIHCWDFNGSAPGGNFNTSPLELDNRVSGNGSITHNLTNAEDFGGNASNACSGSNIGNAFSPRNSENNGNYFDLNFPSSGYQDLILSFWVRRTGTGFNNNQIQYSTDGGSNFSNLASGSFSPINSTAGSVHSFDFSSITEVNDVENLVIRIIIDGATSGTGNNRYDNIKLAGSPIENNTTTEVSAPQNQVASASIVADATTTSANAQDVFSFSVDDLSSGDNLPTEITRMRFVSGVNNTSNWATQLQGINLIDENENIFSPTVSISENELILEFVNPISIPDGTSTEFTLAVFLSETNIQDGETIQFEVEGNNSGFEADFSSGSDFSNAFSGGDVTGNQFTIDVQASNIQFSQQPVDTPLNSAMTPAVEVSFVDTNGNLDTSASEEVTITSSGSLANSPATENAVDGRAVFNNITHTSLGNNLTLTASSVGFSNITSQSFNIGTMFIAVQNFDNATPNWNYSKNINFFDDSWGSAYFGIINISNASPLNFSEFDNNILGENDLDSPNGTSNFAELEFENINISGYENVNLSLDWQAVGYNTGSDFLKYELIYDGENQGEVFVFDGGQTGENGSGTISVNVPNSVNQVGLRYIISSNGATGYSGLDNIELSGTSNDTDSQIVAPSTPIPSGTIVADEAINVSNSVKVLRFDVTDSGSLDGVSTEINTLRFVPGNANTANWSEIIEGVRIESGSFLAQSNQNLTITDQELILEITNNSGGLMTVNDGSTKTFELSIFIKSSDITDQEVIQMAIEDGNSNQFVNSSGSSFSRNISGFEGNIFNIDVQGDGLEFITEASSTILGEAMFPVQIANTDTEGNIDLSLTETISITSTGVLQNSPVTASPESGIATFDNLIHTELDSGIQLTANANGYTSVNSQNFNIIETPSLLISEVADPGDDFNGRFVELYNTGTEAINFSENTYFLHNATNNSSVQLTGNLPAKSHYIVSLSDDATFNFTVNYGTISDLVSGVISGNGDDAYFLSTNDSQATLVDVFGVISETNQSGISWSYEDAKATRNIPTVDAPSSSFNLNEWSFSTANVSDMTPNEGDNDYIYNNSWTAEGLGNAPNMQSSDAQNIFVKSGTATLTSDIDINDVVVRENATLLIERRLNISGDFINEGEVIFKSSNARTAVLGQVNPNSEIIGNNFVSERFFSNSNRAFRYISPSINSTGSINENWQEGANDVSENPNPGYGTHITGSQSGADGFDATATGNPSLFQWNANTQEWNAVPNTDTETLQANEAYGILMRGDRSISLTSNDAIGNSTVLRTRGDLLHGNQIVPNLAQNEGEFSLVGNPYQAKVDMDVLLSNAEGLSSQFSYIYDPTLGNRGGYVTVEFQNGNATVTPVGSTVNKNLQVNQAFFVQNISSNPSLTFTENSKVETSTNNGTFSDETSNLESIKIDLKNAELDKIVDGVKINISSDFSETVNFSDAPKFWNEAEWFAIDKSPDFLSVESTSISENNDEIQLYLDNFQTNEYAFRVNLEEFEAAEVSLYDAYTGGNYNLTNTQVNVIAFVTDESIPESIESDRFKLKFDNITLDQQEFNSEKFSVTPNPLTENFFRINLNESFTDSEITVELYDLQGRSVFEKHSKAQNPIEIQVEDQLNSGVYILKVSNASKSFTQKLIVQ
ncbi:beta strand repeat-containing protein [Psychroflexus aestuariivivens]|uniref:beta strand repeat-containing protein n=1 Tax=Psychroflexus aestuariivivens TaxID=1795040 RepID=UPI000FD85B42|nr:lamin tail domain-containing protein [Psychroflexus aestuariivivens]